MSAGYSNRIAQLTVNRKESIKSTMRAIDAGALGTAFIVDDDGKFVGLVTDGDVRGAILRGVRIEEPISKIMNAKPLVLTHNMSEEELLTLQNSDAVRSKIGVGYSMKIPVLDGDARVKDIMLLYPGGKKPALLSRYRSLDLTAVKKVLVIGCGGYLGAVLVRKLLARGFFVDGLDKLMYGDDGIRELYRDKRFKFTEGDIRDVKVLMDAIKGCDAVIHLAAIVGDPACKLDAPETITINYLATKMITEVCKYSQVNRMLFASTCSVYGASDKPGELITEESGLNPVSLYAEMKIKSEIAILEAADDNFSPTILRMATLYGLSPRMRFDLVVNLFSGKAASKQPITVFGGDQWRPLLHLDDAAEAYVRCIEAPIEKVKGQIFNVGSNEQNVRIADLVPILKQVFPGLKVEEREDLVDKRNYSVNFSKISAVLGYAAKKTIADGICEIKQAVESGQIPDYADRKYSNFESLSEQLNAFAVERNPAA